MSKNDISVHDKERAALGATKDAQDISTTARQVVPMPAYTDPNDAAAASGSINFSVEEHPVEHSGDYGGLDNVTTGVHGSLITESGVVKTAIAHTSPPEQATESTESREQWNKTDWETRCRNLGIKTSGTKAELIERVEEFEGMLDEAQVYTDEEWESEIEDAETPDDVAALLNLYSHVGDPNNAAVQAAFTAKSAEFANGDDQ